MMGDARQPLAPGHIAGAVRIMYAATALFAAVVTVLIM
jgi:hypothetical protein